MPSKPTRWQMMGADKPFVPREFEIDLLALDEVLVGIARYDVCHTRAWA
jgi:hypothetical protein